MRTLNDSARFYYDASNRCILRVYAKLGANGWETDGENSVAMIYDRSWNLLVDYDMNGMVKRNYVHGTKTDEVICAGGLYPLTDALGSVIAAANETGGLESSYTYEAFGKLTSASTVPPAYRFLFAGRERLAAFGLTEHRNRYYNPNTGRFLNQDPIGFQGGINLYAYCNNDPFNNIDPFGLDFLGLSSAQWTGVLHFGLGVTSIVLGTVATAGTVGAGSAIGIIAIVGGIQSAAVGICEIINNEPLPATIGDVVQAGTGSEVAGDLTNLAIDAVSLPELGLSLLNILDAASYGISLGQDLDALWQLPTSGTSGTDGIGSFAFMFDTSNLGLETYSTFQTASISIPPISNSSSDWLPTSSMGIPSIFDPTVTTTISTAVSITATGMDFSVAVGMSITTTPNTNNSNLTPNPDANNSNPTPTSGANGGCK